DNIGSCLLRYIQRPSLTAIADNPSICTNTDRRDLLVPPMDGPTLPRAQLCHGLESPLHIPPAPPSPPPKRPRVNLTLGSPKPGIKRRRIQNDTEKSGWFLTRLATWLDASSIFSC